MTEKLDNLIVNKSGKINRTVMDPGIFKNMNKSLVPANYMSVALDARKAVEKQYSLLLEKRTLPDTGWDDDEIEEFVHYLSTLDSNNFKKQCGLGEREARIACQLVAKRHYNFGHGIGRSGDLLESQPKAVGSSIMAGLTNALLLNFFKAIGLRNIKYCFIVPMATSMSLSLCFLSLRELKPKAKYILWSRIDQKACFKSIITSGFQPIIIEPISTSCGLKTNLDEFKQTILKYNDEILCIFSTTSCFAPRECDNIIELGKLAKEYSLHHVVNNAYGLQSHFLIDEVEKASLKGRIDLFVQSTDKNLMVPVGGAIIAGFNEQVVKNVAKTYAGRASSSPTLDVLMTLLSLGKVGYVQLISERKQVFLYLKEQLQIVANKYGDELVNVKRNPISIAYNLKNYSQLKSITCLGSMLFKRGVSGARIITSTENKSIESFEFKGWGSHSSEQNEPYLTVAAAIGITKSEVDIFIMKFEKCLNGIKHETLIK